MRVSFFLGAGDGGTMLAVTSALSSIKAVLPGPLFHIWSDR
jgi:hypothetical protein